MGYPDYTRQAGPRIVCICGSTRFRDDIAAANRDMTLAGHIVLAPGVFIHAGDQISPAGKERLDALHLRKIDLAHWVYVVCPPGPDGQPYIGESTAREIAYARAVGKPVDYSHEATVPEVAYYTGAGTRKRESYYVTPAQADPPGSWYGDLSCGGCGQRAGHPGECAPVKEG